MTRRLGYRPGGSALRAGREHIELRRHVQGSLSKAAIRFWFRDGRERPRLDIDQHQSATWKQSIGLTSKEVAAWWGRPPAGRSSLWAMMWSINRAIDRSAIALLEPANVTGAGSTPATLDGCGGAFRHCKSSTGCARAPSGSRPCAARRVLPPSRESVRRPVLAPSSVSGH